ncbi:pyridoxamine 5'-phosphate oxidase family protein [Candidatus Microgenomates bacterium]|nr:pyridoxamine 5'-phosphate oxidase family protein [Candidatus Microgenomates bacterium]
MTKDQQKVFEYLQTQKLMSLATNGKTLWAATIFYAVDESLNLYVVTGPKTEHGRNFSQNPTVCGTICDSHQLNGDNKIGVQFRGVVEEVNGVESLTRAIALWNRINPGVEKWVNIKNIQANKINSRVFKIKPQVIKLFTTIGDEENELVLNF